MKNLLLFLCIPLSIFAQNQIGTTIIGEKETMRLGLSVSLSSDGSIIATTANDAVRIYKNNNGVWQQIGSTFSGQNVNDFHNSRVSLSSNGKIVAIGRPNKIGNFYREGLVQIYENKNGIWQQIGEDIKGIDLNDALGYNLSLSSDGNIIAISNSKSVVKVFKNEAGVWQQLGEDIIGRTDQDLFGTSVSLSSDGSVVAIGAPFNHDGLADSGYVRIYKNTNGLWQKIGQDINGDAVNDLLGYSLSLSSDGSIVAIGAPYNDGNSYDEGQVRIYKNNDGVWEQIGNTINGNTRNKRLGFSVSLSSYGTVLAIGTPFSKENGEDSGKVCIYKNNAGVWEQLGNDINGDYELNFLGHSLALSSDGNTLVVGGPDYAFGTTKIYSLSSILSSETITNSNYSIYPNPASNQITIDVLNSNLKEVTVLNNLGKELFKSKNNTINTSKLASGIYFISIKTDKGKSTKKLIIN